MEHVARCVGKYPRITTWINGLKVCNFDGATSAHPRYDRQAAYETLGRGGHIGLQVKPMGNRWPEGAVSRWKNLRIRPIVVE